MIEQSTAALLDRLALMASEVEEAREIVEELRRRLEIEEEFVLPVAVVDAVKQVMPRAGHNTFQAIERRARFCFRVWKDKYGPWNLDQAKYAADLLVWAIGEGRGHQAPYPIVYAAVDRLVNHERVHAGFLVRKGDVAPEPVADIRLELSEALG